MKKYTVLSRSDGTSVVPSPDFPLSVNLPFSVIYYIIHHPHFTEIMSGFPRSPHLECVSIWFLAVVFRSAINPTSSNVIMNILESQVTDLNYLAESPLAIPGAMNGQRQSSSAESPGVAPNGGMKRKADESSTTAPQTRTKRNRYISIAW